LQHCKLLLDLNCLSQILTGHTQDDAGYEMRNGSRGENVHYRTPAVERTFSMPSSLQYPLRVPDDPTRISEEWADVHAGYHYALVAACDNAWILRMRSILYAHSERYRRLSVPLAESHAV
jgi:hypothetical protein